MLIGSQRLSSTVVSSLALLLISTLPTTARETIACPLSIVIKGTIDEVREWDQTDPSEITAKLVSFDLVPVSDATRVPSNFLRSLSKPIQPRNPWPVPERDDFRIALVCIYGNTNGTVSRILPDDIRICWSEGSKYGELTMQYCE